MKFLFLDFDGVLNHNKFYEQRMENYKIGIKTEFPYSEFDLECVKKVNKILKETACNLVISSSWRSDPELRTILNNIGIEANDYEITPYSINRFRGEEIKTFLESKKIETYKYCILDDDTDFYKFQKPFFVHVNSFVGITDENVQKAIKILNS